MPTPAGLTTKEVTSLRQEHGLNTLPDGHLTVAQLLLRQFNNPFIYLLLGAAALAFALGEHLDSLLILGFSLINTALGFFQEYRSEKTARLLQNLVHPTTTVFRDGVKAEIPTVELVPGDLVELTPGDLIPADLKLSSLSSPSLILDESALTGESQPVTYSKVATTLSAGTTILEGSALGTVTKTGKESQLGQISHLTTHTIKESGYEQNIKEISSFTLKLIGLILLVTYLANLALKGPGALGDTTLFAIAIAISVIPEALPVVTTFSLSRGAFRLSKKGVIVKRLSAIEDLGGIQILCTDKTGTLTRNTLTLQDSYHLKGGGDLAALARLAATGTDPIDRTLRDGRDPSPTELDIPFDPLRRYSTTIIKYKKHSYLVLKGAPDTLRALTHHRPGSTEKAWLNKVEQAGHRLVAVAALRLSLNAPPKGPKQLARLESQSQLLGYLALADELKPSAVRAVNAARRLHLDLRIVSGDSPEVTGHIASDLGLITSPKQVVSGRELVGLSSHAFHAKVEQAVVFAAVSPQQKRDILAVLAEHHAVGFVGEGINDAPALKAAGVAIAVKEASDIARSAADILLTKNDLLTIVEGIREGRTVFANTTKYLRITLAANLGNFIALALSSLLVPYLPMLPLQILLVNLLSDFPMIMVATDSVDQQELKSPQHYDLREITIIALIMGTISAVFDMIVFSYFSRLGPAVVQTNWFIESIISELAFFYSLRTTLPLFRSTPPPRAVNLLTFSTIALTVALPFTRLGKSWLSFLTPTFSQLAMVAFLVVAYIVVTEAAKALYYRTPLFSRSRS